MSGFLAILADESSNELALQVASELGYVDANVIFGTPSAALELLQSEGSPTYFFIDIGPNSENVLPEVDQVAQYCNPTTKVVIIGDTNDLNLYRQLLQRGVSEYFVKPAGIDSIKDAFLSGGKKIETDNSSVDGKVVSFLSASSGDGSTTIATNVAYTLAKDYGQSTVVVDMDYQFGLVARNLDLTTSAGLKELYEHPEGSIDETLIESTVIPYKDDMFIISAPRVLGAMPEISSNTIANLIYTLRKKFKYVILDMPHIWTDWMTVLFRESDRSFLVGQLNIKSLTHTSRILDAVNASGVPINNTSIIINRSGSKLKEPITSTDFSMACKKKIDHYISNDSKTISISEDQGVTAVEIGNSVLNRQFKEIAEAISNL